MSSPTRSQSLSRHRAESHLSKWKKGARLIPVQKILRSRRPGPLNFFSALQGPDSALGYRGHRHSLCDDLLQREDLRDRAIRLLGATDMQRATAAMNDAAERLDRYFRQPDSWINSAYGLFIALALWRIGLLTAASCGVAG